MVENIKLLPPGGVRRQDFGRELLGQSRYDHVSTVNQDCEIINEDGTKCGERAIQAFDFDCHAKGDCVYACGQHDFNEFAQKIMDEASSNNWFTSPGINGFGRSY